MKLFIKCGLFICLIMYLYSMPKVFGQDFAWDKKAEFEILGKKDRRITVPFKLINNLIVIEGHINNSGPLKFIFDSGVNKTLITSIPEGEEIFLTGSRIVKLAGLGEGEAVEAFYSKENTFRLENVRGDNVEVFFLKKDIFNLSSFMGTYVHGIIGYDIFANFAVEINYLTEEIYLYDTVAFADKFKSLPNHRKWHKIPIDIQGQKPYLNVEYQHANSSEYVKLRLLIDTGSSNAFSLYNMTHKSIHIPDSRISSLIGVGLSGNVNGFLGRIKGMKINDFTFNEPVVAFPDSVSVRKALELDNRNGSLGGEVLRRFKVIFHYEGGYMLLRKNKDFKDSFEYNKSGIEFNTPIPNIPLYVVSNVIDNSPAEKEGIKVGDIIQQLDGKSTASMGLNQVINYLQRNRGSQYKIRVQRDSTVIDFQFEVSGDLVIDQ